MHVEVHPADYWKLGSYAGNVKAKIGMGDYCTGPQYWDVGLSAWDDDNDQPGDWWFDDWIQVKSVRPYVDFEHMWGSQPAQGVGVKMNVWPDRHMSIPYDQANDVPSLPDGSIEQPEDQVWCLDGSGAGFPNGGVKWGGWGENYLRCLRAPFSLRPVRRRGRTKGWVRHLAQRLLRVSGSGQHVPRCQTLPERRQRFSKQLG